MNYYRCELITKIPKSMGYYGIGYSTDTVLAEDEEEAKNLSSEAYGPEWKVINVEFDSEDF